MAAGNWIPLTKAIDATFKAGIDWTSANLRIVLLTSAYTPSIDTDAAWSAMSGAQVVGAGYTAGGVAVTSPAVTTSSGTPTSGTATAGAASTITLASGASGSDNAYNNMSVAITSGTGAGQQPRLITGYVGSTKVATVSGAFSPAPDATSVYQIANATTASGGSASWSSATIAAKYAALVLSTGGATINSADKPLAIVSLDSGGATISSTASTFSVSGYSVAVTHNAS